MVVIQRAGGSVAGHILGGQGECACPGCEQANFGTCYGTVTARIVRDLAGERAVGDHDRNTVRMRVEAEGELAKLEPGMTVWLSR